MSSSIFFCWDRHHVGVQLLIIIITTTTTASGDTDRAPAEKRQRGDERKIFFFSGRIKQNLLFYKVATALEEKQRLIEEILQLPHQVFDDPSKVIMVMISSSY